MPYGKFIVEVAPSEKGHIHYGNRNLIDLYIVY